MKASSTEHPGPGYPEPPALWDGMPGMSSHHSRTPVPPASWGLPAIHVLVPVEHLLPQLLGLDPAGELQVRELLPQQLGPEQCLQEEVSAQP